MRGLAMGLMNLIRAEPDGFLANLYHLFTQSVFSGFYFIYFVAILLLKVLIAAIPIGIILSAAICIGMSIRDVFHEKKVGSVKAACTTAVLASLVVFLRSPIMAAIDWADLSQVNASWEKTLADLDQDRDKEIEAHRQAQRYKYNR